MKTPTSNKKVQSLEQCSQLQLLKAYSHRFELNYILYQCENLSQGRRAYYFSFLYTLTGITPPPACAGKLCTCAPLWYRVIGGCRPANRETTSDRVRNHPRVCGKNLAPLCGVSSGPGSPPRVREKLQVVAGRYAAFRITPACAGKTNTV